MNRKILEKILIALNKDDVDISYIRGMLETLIESLPEDKVSNMASIGNAGAKYVPAAIAGSPGNAGTPGTGSISMDEADELNRIAAARLGNVDLKAIHTEG